MAIKFKIGIEREIPPLKNGILFISVAERQLLKKLSIRRQEKVLRESCKRQNIDIICCYQAVIGLADGFNGEFKRLYDAIMLEEQHADYIVVNSLKRLGLKDSELDQIIGDFSEKNVKIIEFKKFGVFSAFWIYYVPSKE